MENPISYAWAGASRFARDTIRNGELKKLSVTREEYLEHGSSICRRKFCESSY